MPGGRHLVSSRRLAAAMLASRAAKVSALDRPSRSVKEGTTGIPVISRKQKERNLDLFFAGFGVLVGHLERAGWMVCLTGAVKYVRRVGRIRNSEKNPYLKQSLNLYFRKKIINLT